MTLRLALSAFFAFTGCLGATQLTFPEHNFSIDVPKDWTDMVPLPPLALLAKQNSDQSRRTVIFARKFPSHERDTVAADTRAGVKEAFSAKGYSIDAEKAGVIGGLSFIAFAAHMPTGEVITTYSTAAGDCVYLVHTLRPAAESNDADLRAIAQSFRLLRPAAVPSLTTESKSSSYRFGQFVGYAFMATLVIWALLRLFSKSKAA